MTNHDAGVSYADPMNTFLTPAEVFRRYRWKRTKGYQMLRTPAFPRSIGGAYRLDTLAGWEERQLEGDMAETPTEPVTPADAGHNPTTPTTPTTVSATAASSTSVPSGDGEGEAWSPSTRRPPAARAPKNGGE